MSGEQNAKQALLSRRAARLTWKAGLRAAGGCNSWLGSVEKERECHEGWHSLPATLQVRNALL